MGTQTNTSLSYESVFETGGSFWPKVFRRYIFALLVSQSTITGVFLLKGARFQAYAMVLVMILTYSKFKSTRRRYDGARSHSLPLEVATIMDMNKTAEDEEVFVAKKMNWYLQPALEAKPIAHPEQPFDVGDVGYGEGIGYASDDCCGDENIL